MNKEYLSEIMPYALGAQYQSTVMFLNKGSVIPKKTPNQRQRRKLARQMNRY